MWLDRLSGHTGLEQRTPRRSIQIPRPSFGSRSTSFTNSASSSTSHLPATVKPSNTSNLKNEISSSPPLEVEDPFVALGRVLEAKLSRKDGSAGEGEAPSLHDSERPSTLTSDVDFQGWSLNDFAQHAAAKGGASPGPRQSYDASAADYEKDTEQFQELHNTIHNCDGVLRSVEKYLTNFQSDLAAVSSEIESLQSRSTDLNAKLERRQHVERRLGPVVEKIALSPNVVRKISEGAIDQDWVRALDELRDRSKSIESTYNDRKSPQTKAVEDMKPLISSLSDKAVERIRDYFASRIRGLRSPNINAQILQRQDFLKYKSLLAFLASHQPRLAEEINHAYTNTIRWYYSTHFARYRDSLFKLKIHTTDRFDVLGEDPTSRSNTNTPRLPGHDPFNLGRRIEVLRQPTNAALPSSAAEDSKLPVHLETPFLSFNLALLDNASSEYSFLSSFLPPSLSSHASISRQITSIFSPTFEIGNELTKSLVAESYDALGLLLAVRLTQHFAFLLQRRRIPTLDSYVNSTSMLLWPRFQLVLDAHAESLKKLTRSLPARPGGSAMGNASNAASAAFATLAGGGSSSAAGANTAPHPMTQRFANLLRGVLALSSEARDDEPVSNSLSRLRNEFEAFLTRMGQGFGSGEKGRSARTPFLENNYNLILTILEGNDVRGKLAEDCREQFEGHTGIVAGSPA